MTPLIDIVFLLVIFFLVASQLVQHDTVKEVTLPQTAQGQEEDRGQTGRLVLTVDIEGNYFVAGRQVTLEEIDNMLPGEPSTASIRVRSDKEAPYKFIEPLLYHFSKQGISDVNFAVDRGKK